MRRRAKFDKISRDTHTQYVVWVTSKTCIALANRQASGTKRTSHWRINIPVDANILWACPCLFLLFLARAREREQRRRWLYLSLLLNLWALCQQELAYIRTSLNYYWTFMVQTLLWWTNWEKLPIKLMNQAWTISYTSDWNWHNLRLWVNGASGGWMSEWAKLQLVPILGSKNAFGRMVHARILFVRDDEMVSRKHSKSSKKKA